MGFHILVENRKLRGHFKLVVRYTQTSGIKTFADFEIASATFLKAAGEDEGIIEMKI